MIHLYGSFAAAEEILVSWSTRCGVGDPEVQQVDGKPRFRRFLDLVVRMSRLLTTDQLEGKIPAAPAGNHAHATFQTRDGGGADDERSPWR